MALSIIKRYSSLSFDVGCKLELLFAFLSDSAVGVQSSLYGEYAYDAVYTVARALDRVLTGCASGSMPTCNLEPAKSAFQRELRKQVIAVVLL